MILKFNPLSNGTILQNRYRILGLLGKGGMGAVYRAEHLHLRTEVAIKQTTLLGDEDFIIAFKREAALLANLKHEAIPRVMDFFDENNEHFIVMELINGEDLDERLKRFQKSGIRMLPFSEMRDVSIKLLEVLEYIHSQDIIHKDIKPSNLKITANGNLKLLDFGLAKGSIGLMSQHLSSFLKGATPDYAPPEQLKDESTTQRSDIFSVGATIYHLLSGKVPPNPLTVRAIQIADGEPDPLLLLCDLNTEVPKEFAENLHKAMALNPKRRFDSARQMKKALINKQEEAETDTIIRINPQGNGFENNVPANSNHNKSFGNNIKQPLFPKLVVADEHYDLAVNCQNEGNYDSAIKNYNKALELNPNHSRAILKIKELRDEIAVDGVKTEEVIWFDNELTHNELQWLNKLTSKNPSLAYAYQEALASRLTSTRILESAKQEILLIGERENKVKNLINTKAKNDLIRDLQTDRMNFDAIITQAEEFLIDSQSRLRLIETSANAY